MEIEMKPVVDRYELEDTLRNYLNDNQFSLGDVFFKSIENDSIQLINTSLNSLERAVAEIERCAKNGVDTSNSWKKYRALLTMRELFPDHEEILVNFYW